MADYLAEYPTQHQVTGARVLVTKNVRQMKRWLEIGIVDLISETVFAAQELIESTNAQPLAMQSKSGVSEYSSIFFLGLIIG